MTDEELKRKEEAKQARYQKLAEMGMKYRFKPGHENARYKHKTRVNRLTEVLRECMREEIEFEDPTDKQKKWMKIEHAVALKLLQRALDGNLRAIEVVFDRVDGKVSEKIELEDVTDSVEVENKITYNFSNLSADELLYLRNVMTKLSPGADVKALLSNLNKDTRPVLVDSVVDPVEDEK